MQAAVINILINLQSKQLGNYGDVKICFPLPLHSTGTDRAFKFLNMPFMFSRALKSLWTVGLLRDAPSSPIPTGRVAILFIQWQEVPGSSLLLRLDSRNLFLHGTPPPHSLEFVCHSDIRGLCFSVKHTIWALSIYPFSVCLRFFNLSGRTRQTFTVKLKRTTAAFNNILTLHIYYTLLVFM